MTERGMRTFTDEARRPWGDRCNRASLRHWSATAQDNGHICVRWGLVLLAGLLQFLSGHPLIFAAVNASHSNMASGAANY
ncbi:MAG: hypothetical protein ACYTGL_15660 [Planctomycetota bacterium]|jgi:hypothetical protein